MEKERGLFCFIFPSKTVTFRKGANVLVLEAVEKL